MKNTLLAIGATVAAVIILLQVLILFRLNRIERTAESAEVSASEVVDLAKEAKGIEVLGHQSHPLKWRDAEGRQMYISGGR